MYQPSKEEEMRYLREAREEYYRRQKRNERIEAEFKVTKEEMEKIKAENMDIKALLNEKNAEIARLKAELEVRK